MFRRVVLVTLDGVGIGALPDAAAFGDADAATLPHVAAAVGGLQLPHLAALGLGCLDGVQLVPPAAAIAGAYGRMAEQSVAKDSTAGHWELAGLALAEPLPTFPQGFPPALIEAFRRETGYEPLGNIAASGTEVIRLLGEEHLRTGRPIVYTSVDSVFQIAAHEEVIPLPQLYALCEQARTLVDAWHIGRVIARPFVGHDADSFRRTPHRHDYSLPPVGPTLLDQLTEAGLTVHGVGKLSDLFAGRGVTTASLTRDNDDGVRAILAALTEMTAGLVFANLIDFDMLYGHRRDAPGFAQALERFDRQLPALMAAMTAEDLLILTADHGCDPTTAGTDHTREYVPLLVWHSRMRTAVPLGDRATFADVAATVAENFGVEPLAGCSFLAQLVQ